MRSEKMKSLAYWITTATVATPLVLGGAMDAAAPPGPVAFLAHLGYPAYFCTLIGVWKVLGGIAILAPRFPRLKEWAYAGIVFDFTGAAISHAVAGDRAGYVLVPLVLTILAALSYTLRPRSRRLEAVAVEVAPKTPRPVAVEATV
jgi:uncharacterized membrane protein YphA (DoxX/SURF4 family)